MITYRTLATVIDLVVAFIPALATTMSKLELFDFEYFSYMVGFSYLLHTSILLFVSKKYTLGEKFFRICAHSISSQMVKTKVLLIRNFLFCLLFMAPLISYGDIVDFGFSLTVFLGAQLMIFSRNDYGKPMTGLDLLFKTYYGKIE